MNSARVWDAITGAELHSFTHGHIVKTVEFSPDSRRFVSGGHEVRTAVSLPPSLSLLARWPLVFFCFCFCFF